MQIEAVKDARKKIDGLAQLTKVLTVPPFNKDFPNYQPEEIKNAVTCLYMAKAWLGKVLGELGSPSPYPKDGSRTTIADIEPTADKAIEVADFPLLPEQWDDANQSHIAKVDFIRQCIETL